MFLTYMPQVGTKVISQALATFTTLDALVINHGVLEPLTRIADSTAAEWRSLYDINFFSAIALVRLLPQLLLSQLLLPSIPFSSNYKESTNTPIRPLAPLCHPRPPRHQRPYNTNLLRRRRIGLRHMGGIWLLQSSVQPSRPDARGGRTTDHDPRHPARHRRHRHAGRDPHRGPGGYESLGHGEIHRTACGQKALEPGARGRGAGAVGCGWEGWGGGT